MKKLGFEDFDSELYTDVITIREKIKSTEQQIKTAKKLIRRYQGDLHEYIKISVAFQRVLLLDKYKKMNESIEKDEKYVKEFEESK